jgi:hypothetical protein
MNRLNKTAQRIRSLLDPRGRRDAIRLLKDKPHHSRIRDEIALAFDRDYYRSTYPDIAEVMQHDNGFDPVLHYVTHGWLEGRNPTAQFNTNDYRTGHPDVDATGVNPFLHYLRSGAAARAVFKTQEGEAQIAAELAEPDAVLATQDPPGAAQSVSPELVQVLSKEFDEAFYLEQYPDVAACASEGRLDPLIHYIQAGAKEGRNPNASFCTNEYLEFNPDVAAAGINPFYHYLVAGRREGRPTSIPGGFRTRYLKSIKSLNERAKAWARPIDHTPPLAQAAMDSLVARAANVARGQVVVALSHDDYVENLGGVQLCILREQKAFEEKGFVYLHFSPVQPLPMLAPATRWRDQLYSVRFNGIKAGIASATVIAQAILRAADNLDRALVVIHAMHGSSPEFVSSACRAMSRARKYYWVHDYFGISPGYNLLRNDIAYCQAPPPTSAGCAICVYGEERSEHLSRFKSMFNGVRFSILAPSESAARIWRRHYTDHVVSVVPHCSLVDRGHIQSNAAERRVRVGFIGHPAMHKGWNAFEAVLKLADPRKVEFHYFGTADLTHPSIEKHQVRVGFDRPFDMIQAIRAAELDYAFVWSLCPETFCLAAYEAIAGGAKIITNQNSGNVADLVGGSGFGVVLKDEAQVVEFLHAPDRVAESTRPQFELRLGSLTAGLQTPVVQ